MQKPVQKAFDKVLVPAQTDRGPLSKTLIEKETRRVAAEIEAFYGPYQGDPAAAPLVVSVLFGALHVYPMLMESFSAEFATFPGVVRAKSYAEGNQRTAVAISDAVFATQPTNRRVLIVDDIVESGQTLFSLKQWFLDRGAADVRCFALLNKPEKREFPDVVDWSVFNLEPGQWVVGKGMDDNGLFRHFPNVVVLQDAKPSPPAS